MHSKLTRDELRIIEQTKKEGEQQNEQESKSPAAGLRKRVMAYVWLVLIFLLVVVVAKIVFGWLALSATHTP